MIGKKKFPETSIDIHRYVNSNLKNPNQPLIDRPTPLTLCCNNGRAETPTKKTLPLSQKMLQCALLSGREAMPKFLLSAEFTKMEQTIKSIFHPVKRRMKAETAR